MAQLNNQIYLNWQDYITDKFPADQFNITIKEIPEEKTDTITVTLKDGSSRTSLVFDIIDNNLCRECFYHPDTILYNAENDRERKRSCMVSDYELSDENLAAMDEYLNIPLRYGYTERTVYANGKFRRFELLYKGRIHRVYDNTSAGGCLLSIITWPFRSLKKANNEEIKDISIPPMMTC